MRAELRCGKRFSVRGPVADLDAREGRHRHERAIGRLDLQVQQRIERRAILVADLRDDLVAAVEIVEAVDVRAAEHRAQLAPDRRQVEAEIREPLAIQHDARLRQVDLQVGVDVQELAAGPAGVEHGLRRRQQLLDRRLALHDHFDVVLARRRQRRIQARKHAQSGTCDTAPYTSPYISSVERSRSFQSFATRPPKPPHVRGQRPHEVALPETPVRPSPPAANRVGRLQRGIRRALRRTG